MTDGMDFLKMTDEELAQQFNYWKKTAEKRMKIFATEHYGTELEEKTYRDYQLADRNAQNAYLEINKRETSS